MNIPAVAKVRCSRCDRGDDMVIDAPAHQC